MVLNLAASWGPGSVEDRSYFKTSGMKMLSIEVLSPADDSEVRGVSSWGQSAAVRCIFATPDLM